MDSGGEAVESGLLPRPRGTAVCGGPVHGVGSVLKRFNS